MSDLPISSILAIPLTASMQSGTRTSQGEFGAVSIVLVEIRSGDSLVGYGECLARFGPRAYALFINEVLAPKLIGQSAFDIRRLWQQMRASLSGRAGGMLIESIAGVDIALWDLVGKALAGMLAQLREGLWRGSGPLVFFHSGGAPGLFANAAKMLPLMPS